MGKGKAKTGGSGKSGTVKVAKLPKKKCCVSTKRCNRCPLRMLKEGTLPVGYTVRKRRLVKVSVELVGPTPSLVAGAAEKKSKKKPKKQKRAA